MTTTCPFCGDAPEWAMNDYTTFRCGTQVYLSGAAPYRAIHCVDRQIAKKDARIEQLEIALRMCVDAAVWVGVATITKETVDAEAADLDPIAACHPCDLPILAGAEQVEPGIFMLG